jgi:hypothetical protein
VIKPGTPQRGASERRQVARVNGFSSYCPDEVMFLVKDLSGALVEVSRADYEQGIDEGRHYAEMLPEEEFWPTDEALDLFDRALRRSAQRLALAVGIATEQVLVRRGSRTVLVSLCQTGTPVGILLRRWAKWRHGLKLPHYTISVVRGHGVDANALSHVLDRHDPGAIQFVDGWTGKGAIARELTATVRRRHRQNGTAPSDDLAVLVDPGDCAAIAGTGDDFLVPNACLNATVSGLVSRTVVTAELVGPDDFHGAKYYPEMLNHDRSAQFLDAISGEFASVRFQVDAHTARCDRSAVLPSFVGERRARSLADEYGFDDVNLVKAGVSETVRMLLHRPAQRVLVHPAAGDDVQDVLWLAARRSVPAEERFDLRYACVGLMQAPASHSVRDAPENRAEETGTDR